MRAINLSFITLLLFLVTSGAQAIALVAAELPPYVMRTKQGAPSGIAIEIMKEAAHRLGEPLTIELMPLSRSLIQVTYRNDMLLLPLVRSSQREHLYYWIAPLFEDEFVIVSEHRFHPSPLKSKDLPSLRVGTMRDSFGQYLLKQRLNLDSQTVSTEVLNAHKLQRRRIDAWVGAWNAIRYSQQEGGHAVDQLVKGETLMRTQFFLAASKEFPFTEGRRWQTVIDSMRQDGTLARIIRQYDYQEPE